MDRRDAKKIRAGRESACDADIDNHFDEYEFLIWRNLTELLYYRNIRNGMTIAQIGQKLDRRLQVEMNKIEQNVKKHSTNVSQQNK
jgi:hypothetical protein